MIADKYITALLVSINDKKYSALKSILSVAVSEVMSEDGKQLFLYQLQFNHREDNAIILEELAAVITGIAGNRLEFDDTFRYSLELFKALDFVFKEAVREYLGNSMEIYKLYPSAVVSDTILALSDKEPEDIKDFLKYIFHVILDYIKLPDELSEILSTTIHIYMGKERTLESLIEGIKRRLENKKTISFKLSSGARDIEVEVSKYPNPADLSKYIYSLVLDGEVIDNYDNIEELAKVIIERVS